MKDSSPRIKRIAVNRLLVDGVTICPAVVELQGERVLSFCSLTEELALTEWLGGTLQLVKEGGIYRVRI
uniref:Uncharacterized protein n=1 Tax=Prevotella sp. GTC17254 TaxID=3236794 RepID=A0AB33IXY2_9BACT